MSIHGLGFNTPPLERRTPPAPRGPNSMGIREVRLVSQPLSTRADLASLEFQTLRGEPTRLPAQAIEAARFTSHPRGPSVQAAGFTSDPEGPRMHHGSPMHYSEEGLPPTDTPPQAGWGPTVEEQHFTSQPNAYPMPGVDFVSRPDTPEGGWDPTLFFWKGSFYRIKIKIHGEETTFNNVNWQEIHERHLPHFLQMIEELEQHEEKLKEATRYQFEYKNHYFEDAVLRFATATNAPTQTIRMENYPDLDTRPNMRLFHEFSMEVSRYPFPSAAREEHDTTHHRLTQSDRGGIQNDLDAEDMQNCLELLSKEHPEFTAMQPIRVDTPHLVDSITEYVRHALPQKEWEGKMLLVPVSLPGGHHLTLFLHFKAQEITILTYQDAQYREESRFIDELPSSLGHALRQDARFANLPLLTPPRIPLPELNDGMRRLDLITYLVENSNKNPLAHTEYSTPTDEQLQERRQALAARFQPHEEAPPSQARSWKEKIQEKLPFFRKKDK